MSASSSQSRVTITLNLTGQAKTIRGIQDTETALKSLGDTAAAVAEKVGTATDAMAAQIDTANRSVTTSADTAAASMKAQADTAAASAVKTADATEASAARVSAASKSASGGIMGMLTSFKALSIGAASYLGVKSFTSYSTAMTKLSTVAGMTQGQVAKLNSEILKTAPALRQSPTALAQAAYSPTSERFGLAGTEQVVKWAANLSNISGAPIAGGAGSTSYAISTMLQTLGWKPTSANVAKVAAMIRGATSAGDMQLSDLTGAMSTGILNTGKTYGIDPEATLGTLAYFTSQGVPAQEAATRLRMTESLMVGNSAQAAKYAKALGLSSSTSTESALSARLAGLGLSPTVFGSMFKRGTVGWEQAWQLLSTRINALPAAQAEAVWSKVLGGGRSDATGMQLAQGAMSGQLQGFINSVIGSSTVAGANQAVSTYNKSPQGQLKLFGAELTTFATQFGAVVMPVLEQLMGILGPLLSLFAQHKTLLMALTALIGGELAIKLFGLVRDLKLVKAAGSALKDLKAFDSIITGAGDAESAVGRLVQKLLDTKSAVDTIGGEAAASTAAGGSGSGLAALGGLGLAAAPAAILAATGVAAVGGGAYAMYQMLQNDQNVNWMRTHGGLGISLAPTGAELGGAAKFNTGLQSGLAAYARQHGIPGYASGGVTSGPMAIVGEGSKLWPEYVVPTDPTYRSRALALFQSLGGQLLGPGLPQMLIAMGVSKSKNKTLGGAGVAGGSNMQLGQRMAAALGWNGQEWGALNALWQRESGWSNTARNPSSGAYGIPQALPPTKLPYAGQAAGGSHPSTQIQWGLQYIRQRYGDPLGAWAHEQNFGWYAKGGILPFASYDSGGLLPEGVSIAHNGTGKPEPVGHNLVAGGGGDLTVKVVLDSKVVGQAVVKDFRARAARR